MSTGNATRVVRLGATDYAVDRDWGGLHRAGQTAALSEVACLGDRVYALQRADPPLLVFERDGRQVDGLASGLILDGHGLSAGRRETLLVADRDAHQVLRVDSRGDVVQRWGERHRPRWQAPFNHPAAAAEGPDDGIWVADGYGNGRLHRFAGDGALLWSVGALGDAPGAFLTPHAVAVAADGRAFVCDRDNDRVQVFAADGTLLDIWIGFARPMAIAIDRDGWVWVTDQVPSLHRIAADGQGRSRARPAANLPHGLATADDGTVYLVEMNPPSLVRLQPI
ncbi:MAG: hypothetical protein AAFX81_18180 [Pseudomonadota bacterium]